MNVPEIGQCVLVRKRPAIVRNKVGSPGDRDGVITHLLELEYIDGYKHPSEETIVWEREINPQIYSVYEFPDIAPQQHPDSPSRFGAFIDAMTWDAQGVYHCREHAVSYSSGTMLSPWFSAIQVEDYQLYPVLQAMAMPRVNLLLADDVGLGKTIEAGLIIQELVKQRRIRKMLILCPSSLQPQWQDEMRDKFNLDFTILDSDQVYKVQRELGVDANPWKVSPRIITSMDYLKQPDVLQKFLTTSEQLSPEGSATLPWDVLIVDEAHNFAPSQYADSSYRCQMLMEIAPFFEHRLFLTATPHNGYTVSFSGLIELLDPVRFTQKSELDDHDFAQLSLVMIRRMRADLNIGRAVPRFPTRDVSGIPLVISESETRLFEAMRQYRLEGTKHLARHGTKEKNLAQFIFSLLTKRLLSSSYAFARTWWRHVKGFDMEGYGFDEAEQSRARAESVVEDDDEKIMREYDAARLGASWLSHYRDELSPHLEEISRELKQLGWTPSVTSNEAQSGKNFPTDSKFEKLFQWIQEKLLFDDGEFRKDERVIIFTEYKDTLDYLVVRLQESGLEYPVVQKLFGGAPTEHRQQVKVEFNDPESPLRILVATDAASEGLNLQTSCRYVIHQEIPWNPMRLEQRNGRVDRHGQARNVSIFHFVSNQVADLEFLDFVVNKVETVRDDLGSVGKVLDEAVTEYFNKGTVNDKSIENRVEKTREQSDDRNDLARGLHGSNREYRAAEATFHAAQQEFGISEDHITRLLYEAMHLDGGALRAEGNGVHRIETTPPHWKATIEQSLLTSASNTSGAQPKLVFSPDRVTSLVNGRTMFSPGKDTRLLALGHPVMQKALSTFTRRVWLPVEESQIQRWTVSETELPSACPIVFSFFFHITLRNKLGERFRSGIIEVPVIVSEPPSIVLEAVWAQIRKQQWTDIADPSWGRIRSAIHAHWHQAKEFAENERGRLIELVQTATSRELVTELERQVKDQESLFAERMRVLEAAKDPRHIERLRKALLKAEEKKLQLTFDEELNELYQHEYLELKEKVSDAEWERFHSHVELLKERLSIERERVIEKVLPNRYTLAADGIEVFPVGVHIVVSHGDAAS